MVVTGTVTYNDFEGGFWGIETDDKQQFRPVDGLPLPLQRAGCRIEAEIELAEGISLHMWGRPVTVRSIKKIESEQ
ncbi:MAG: hypothetical protein HKN13_08245 [Rhodothermales bacterium]|nr:hypothetical protein [Rhodothermales bacterium]